MSTKRQSPFNGHTTTRNANYTEDDSKRRRIRNATPEKFPETVSTGYTTMNKLEKAINRIMSVAFEDWYGSKVFVDQNQQIQVEFYFRPTPVATEEDVANSKRAFVPIELNVNQGANALENKINYIDAAARRNSNFKMTPYAAEVLYSYLFSYITGVNWKKPDTYRDRNLVAEVCDQQSFNYGQMPVTYCRVAGIDIFKVIRTIYGDKDENGKRYAYSINPIRPYTTYYTFDGQQNTNPASNWLITIMRMTEEQFKETMDGLGMSNGTGISVTTDI